MDRSYAWSHHRDGWKRVEALVAEHLASPDGVLFVSAVEDQLWYRRPLLEPWVGFVHQVPKHHLPGFPDLERLVELPAWRSSIPHCRGVWVLSSYLGEHLERLGVPVPIERVEYPSNHDVPPFDLARFQGVHPRTVLHVGEFLRNFQAFFDLDAPGYDKVLLVPSDWEQHSAGVRFHPSVECRAAVSPDDYDRLLTSSVVFLQLKDAPANTTVVECLVRGTPILVNRIGGVAEYLGDDYPLYHDGIAHAARLLQDTSRIAAAHAWLRDRGPRHCTDAGFLETLTSGAIYRSLPTTPSERDGLRASHSATQLPSQ